MQIKAKLGKTQAELAQEIGMSRQQFNAYLCGRVKPTIELALKIEDVTGGKVKATKLRPDLKDIAKRVLGSL